MKAILATTESINTKPLPEIRMIADSAIAHDREPLWLDLDREPVVALLCPCWRIGRLGRNIKPQFVSRYIDALCTCAVIVPESFAGCPMQAPEIIFASTEAVISSPDMPVNDDTRLEPFALQAVAELSKYMIFKNGDRLIDISHPTQIPMTPGRDIEARCTLPQFPPVRLRVR